MTRSKPFLAIVGAGVLLATIVLRSPTPVQAANVSIFSDGFESGTVSAWTQSARLVAQQQYFATGTWGGRATTSGASGFASETLAVPKTEVTLSANVEVLSAGSTLTLLRFRTSTGAGIASLKVNKTGKLLTRNEVAGVNVVSTTSLGFSAWHALTLHAVVGGASSTLDVSLDGLPVTDLSTSTSLGTSPIARVQIGTTGAVTGDVVFDDVNATADVVTRTDPLIVAAGDICPATPPGCKATANQILAVQPDLALTLGDNQYPKGTLAQYLASYDTTWGKFKAITRPAPGNHEWYTANAQGYRDYFGPTVQTNGGLWYSYNLGDWHLISLDSDCTKLVGGCDPGGAEYTWLQQDLANDTHTCTLAYWHHPRFSSGGDHGGTTTVSPFWDLLALDGAELVLSGHNHNYERFAAQTSTGVADANGVRQFVVGTGGGPADTLSTIQPNSEKAFTGSKGVIELTLQTDAYSWQFVDVFGNVLDQGTDSCH